MLLNLLCQNKNIVAYWIVTIVKNDKYFDEKRVRDLKASQERSSLLHGSIKQYKLQRLEVDNLIYLNGFSS